MHDPFIVLVAVSAWLLPCFVVGRTASSFHRPPATWFLLALLLSPVVAFVLLHIAGDPQEALTLQEKEEQIRQQHPGRKDIREAALNEMKCPHCGAAINPITEDGLHSSEREPWLLICNQCQGTVEPDY